MANGKGPGSKHKRVRANTPTSLNPLRKEKEDKKRNKRLSKLKDLERERRERIRIEKGTKNIDRKIKRKKKQIAGKTFLQKLKRWDGTWK
jgi:hypothetical protein|tara:strand:- start:227 stop:496 length:270 start_codon:yes stop_codon:yes gene_type:complete